MAWLMQRVKCGLRRCCRSGFFVEERASEQAACLAFHLWAQASDVRIAADVTALANEARLVPKTLTLSILNRVTTHNYSLLFHSLMVAIS
jgi:hypothetical protein